MHSDKVIQDSGHGVTILYYYNVEKGFKFIGDDPEGRVIPIDKETREKVYNNCGISGLESDMPAKAYLDKFYLHNRCLLFPSGIWMSETARYPQYLRYRPGANTSFRVSGMTRFTALTDNCGAICVGYNPDADHILNLRREVHKIKDKTMFMPLSEQSYLIPTENCTFGDKKIGMGEIAKAHTDFDEVVFEQSGYLIEYIKEPLTLEDELINYCHQWIDQKIEVFER